MSVDRMIREKWIESREARRELQSERGGRHLMTCVRRVRDQLPVAMLCA